MKRLLLFTIPLFALNSFAQFSSKKMEKYIIELTEMVTDTSYISPDPNVIEELDEPILEYIVNDRATLWEFSTKKNFSDNEAYSTFQKIYKRGNQSDFLFMTRSDNPAIRVYGFWALLKNKKLGPAENVLKAEKENEDQVFWNSFGCEIFPRGTSSLMEELKEKYEKHGS